jgi:hypothetical protein
MNYWQPILTLIVAAAALGVSWVYNRSQVRIARAKLKLDLFERRLAIYQKVTDYMDHQYTVEAVGVDATPFFQSISSMKWLFDESVERWVYDELMAEVRKMWAAHHEQDNAERGPAKAKAVRAQVTVKQAYHNQYGRRDEVFGPFLRLHAA